VVESYERLKAQSIIRQEKTEKVRLVGQEEFARNKKKENEN